MENLKGNLRNTRDSIIKIRIRDRNGIPQHSAEFRLDDKSSLIRELRILKDKFGVSVIRFSNESKEEHTKQLTQEVNEEKQKLKEWREKTKLYFAMLVGVVGLFESQLRFKMFKNNDFEIMYLDKRIAYFKDYSEQKPSLNPPFSSVYLCSDILPKQIIFEEIIKPKYKKQK